jgi:hypothetical protein
MIVSLLGCLICFIGLLALNIPDPSLPSQVATLVAVLGGLGAAVGGAIWATLVEGSA